MPRAGYSIRVRARSRSGKTPFGEVLLALAAVSLLAYAAIERGYVVVPGLEMVETARGDWIDFRFALCAGRGGTCVIDGDTIRIEGQPIRIADIDTPEVRGYQCAQELALGQAATQRLIELVNAGPFELGAYERDEDVYGRKLRILKRDGQSIGMQLVAEGLARPW